MRLAAHLTPTERNSAMPFSNYKSISAVAKEFQINYLRDNFIVETEFAVSEVFRNELELIFNDRKHPGYKPPDSFLRRLRTQK